MQRLLLVLVVFAAAGCYHATVETGAAPSPQSVSKGWASGWILGLVPPSTVETAAKCPNGAARVETKLSFGNQLVGLLTLGIYTPMSIKVACAAGPSGGGGEPAVEQGEAFATPEAVVEEAVRRSLASGQGVWVRFQ